jgi:hypothetical protein
MPREVFLDLVVPRHRLTNFCPGILIPVMLSAMSDENCAFLFDFLNELASLHASSSSECWRTFGIAPEDKSL